MTVTHQINILVNATNAQNSVNNLNNQLTRTTNIVNNINTTNINNFNRQLNNTNTNATQGAFAMKKLAAAMSALGLVYLAKQAYDVVEAFTRITNQIRQTTTSSTELTEVTNRLISISQGSNQTLEGTASLYTRFRLSVDEAKVSSERLLGVVDTISKSLSISGATAAESAGAMRQLSQAVASGVLRGEEFNSISEQAPAILRAVQSATGKTAGELRKLAADGAITADVLIQSLERYAKKVDKDFKASNTTVGDGLTNLVTGLTVLAGNYDKATGLTTAFANNLTTLGKKLSDPALLDRLKTVADTVKGSFEQALVFFKKWSALVRLEYDLINAVFTDSTIGQAMDRYNAKLTEMAIKAKEASMIKQSNVKRGGFFEARQPLIDISAPAKVDTDAQEKAARAAEKRAEDARKKAMQDRFDTYNEFNDALLAEAAAREISDREITSARTTTEAMKLELATRSQVAQFYREADLVGIDNTYKYQIAMANAKNQQERALVDQRRAEDQARRDEQLRQALTNAELEESQVAMIKQAYKEQSLVAEEIYQQQLTVIKEEGVRSRAAIEEAQNSAALSQALGLGEQLMSVADGHSRRTFEIAKKGAIASAIISTYQGIAKGVALGYPAAIPAVAAAALTGFAQVQKIKSTNYGGGAASAGSAGGGGGLSTTANSEPSFVQKQVIDIRGINADSLLTGAQLVDILSRDDKAIVMLNGAQADAQRRGVI